MSIIMLYLYSFLLNEPFLCKGNITPSDQVLRKYPHANIVLKSLAKIGIKVLFPCMKNALNNKSKPSAIFRFNCFSTLSTTLTVKVKNSFSVILGFSATLLRFFYILQYYLTFSHLVYLFEAYQSIFYIHWNKQHINFYIFTYKITVSLFGTIIHVQCNMKSISKFFISMIIINIMTAIIYTRVHTTNRVSDFL